MQVHIINQPDEEIISYLKNRLDKSITLSFGKKITEPDKVKVLVAGRPKTEQLKELRSLDVLIIPWTGIPSETLNILKAFPGIKIHNLHHNAHAAAELALALLFAVAKKVIPHDQDLRRGNWTLRYSTIKTQLLQGKTALILGYGNIGKLVKESLTALGLEVRVIRRNAPENDGENLIFPPHALDDLLPKAEILILALPLTKETRGLIGKKELSLLPPSAILINISRGLVVDQKALYSVLLKGKIFGAGLDVWYNYPAGEREQGHTLPSDYPFHKLDNVVLSPHRGGLVEDTETLRMAALSRLLNAASRGDPIPNAVDLKMGY